MVILSPRDCGILNSRPKTEIFRAGISSSSDIIVNPTCLAARRPLLYQSRGALSVPQPFNRYMRALNGDCEKRLRENPGKCEMRLCKAEKGLL
jgi:hypothetical protein